jgi:hypothetical protein
MVGVWNIIEPYEERSRDTLGMQGEVSRFGCARRALPSTHPN